MAILNGIIPAQNFEIIRDRIGEILADEFANQFTLSGNPDINPTIFIERFVAFDKTEYPAINVSLLKGEYDNKDARQADGTYVYIIDCYTSAKDTAGEQGDTQSIITLHKILGMCRAILENPGYRTLGYTPPFNCSVYISSIAILDAQNTPDATHSAQGRIEFVVRIPEYTALITPPLISAYRTVVKLYNTEKGYQWGLNDALLTDEIADDITTEDGQNTFVTEN